AIRGAVGGCVENRLAKLAREARPLNGFTMNRCASDGARVAGGGTCAAACSSLRSALARASGSCERYAPDSSAWYSRDRDTAIWINAAAMGARTHAMIRANGPRGLFRSSRLPPKKKANRARKVIDMAMAAAMDPMRMS